jgi:hypothetical protein
MKQNREIFCCNEAKFKFQVKIDTCHACKQEAENFGASEGFLALSFQISGIALQLQTVARKSFLCPHYRADLAIAAIHHPYIQFTAASHLPCDIPIEPLSAPPPQSSQALAASKARRRERGAWLPALLCSRRVPLRLRPSARQRHRARIASAPTPPAS